MKLSFVVPIYNVEEYLPQCLDSLINQTYHDIEIICVNDGSTDECGNILAEYALKDNRIQVLTQENRGTLIARKKGIFAATGEFILCIDPDDWFDLNTIEIVVNTIEQTGADIIQFGFTIEEGTLISPEQRQNIDMFFNRQIKHIDGSEALLRAAFIDNTLSYNQCGKAIRSNIAKQAFSIIPDIRCIFAEDQCSGFLLFCNTNTLHSISHRFYHYRAGVGISTKKNLTIKEFKEALNAFTFLNVLNNFIEKQYNNKALHHQIVSDIQQSMIETCTELGAERTIGYSDAKEWIQPLCGQILTNDIPLILARKLSARDRQITSYLHEIETYKQVIGACKQDVETCKQDVETCKQEILKQRRKRKKERAIWLIISFCLILCLSLLLFIS